MNAFFRFFLTAAVCGWLAACPVSALQDPQDALYEDSLTELSDALSKQAQDTAGDLGPAVSGDFAGALGQVLSNIFKPAKTYFTQTVRSAAVVLIICALCAGVRVFAESSSRVLVFAGTAAIAAACLGKLGSVMTLGQQALEELSVFSKTLLPALCAAEVMSGSVSGAGVVYTAVLFVCDILITVIAQVMTPLVYAYCALVTAHCVCANEGILKLSRLLKNGITWSLKLLLGIFTGYLAISSVLAGSANAVAVKTLKLASGAVPLVGGVISDAAETVVAGAAAVKGVIGAVGIVGIASIILLPFIKLAVSYILYKLAAVLAAMTGVGELAAYAEHLSDGFVLILAMCAACTLMVLVGVFAAILGAVGI